MSLRYVTQMVWNHACCAILKICTNQQHCTQQTPLYRALCPPVHEFVTIKRNSTAGFHATSTTCLQLHMPPAENMTAPAAPRRPRAMTLWVLAEEAAQSQVLQRPFPASCAVIWISAKPRLHMAIRTSKRAAGHQSCGDCNCTGVHSYGCHLLPRVGI